MKRQTPHRTVKHTKRKTDKLTIAGIGFVLLTTLIVYGQVYKYEFVNYDDPKYVAANRQVVGGLTLEGIKWAFTAKHASNWHPLTWLSHMTDCELFGADAGKHHLVNLLFHLANTLLLFIVLYQMTRARWRCVFVAGLFALHPLHTESVAWIAERKDVLSTFFMLLTLWAYVRYTRHKNWRRYLLIMLLFSAGLMAKPMLVTLPFVLLLLDYWPLERFQWKYQDIKTVLRLLFEKLPLFLLTGLSCLITLSAQQKVTVSLQGLDIYDRIGSALISYVVYLSKMIWPVKLAVFYPHSRTSVIRQQIAAAVILLVLTIIVICFRRRYRYAVTGWLWYLCTLIPVIGLVQVGLQKYADRYTYIPLIGIFIIIAWAGAELSKLLSLRYRKIIPALSAVTVFLVLAVCTSLQAGYWRNSTTLYEHALAVTENNHVAHSNLAIVLMEEGKYDRALRHIDSALNIYPAYGQAMANWASVMIQKGRDDLVIERCLRFLQKYPGNCQLHNNLANALRSKGRIDEAVIHYRRALELRENSWQVYYNLALIFAGKGKLEQALEHYNRAYQLNPSHPLIKKDLNETLTLQQKLKHDR